MASRFKIGSNVWALLWNTRVVEGTIIEVVRSLTKDGIFYPILLKLNTTYPGSNNNIEVYHFDLFLRPQEKEELLDKLNLNYETIKNSIKGVSSIDNNKR